MVKMDALRRAVRETALARLPLCVHCSMRSFGCVEGGAETVVNTLLAEGCTILVPTFSDDFAVPPPAEHRPERNGWDYAAFAGRTGGIGRVFAPDTDEITSEEMGALAACVLHRPDRMRGRHPLCSFAAVGPLASRLTEPQTPTNPMAPLRALAKAGGAVVLMGVDLDKMTLLHAAEELSGRSLFVRWANGPDGAPMAVRVGGCSAGFGRLEPTLRPFVRTCRVGASRWAAYPAKESLAAAAEKIRSDPQITHCGRATCERCRDAVLGGPVLE